MAGQEGWLTGFGRIMSTLRAPALLFYLFSRSTLLGSKTGFAFTVSAFVAGLAIVATAPFITAPGYSDVVLALGVSAFVVGGLFLVVRIGLVWRVLLVVLAATGIVWLLVDLSPLPDLRPAVWIPIGLLEFVVLLFTIFGSLPLPRRRWI
jgi:hypothetical protein